MKSKVLVISAALLVSAATVKAQLNVGSNTAPVTTLDVQGKAYVRDSLGVGISSPKAPLHVVNPTNPTIIYADGYGTTGAPAASIYLRGARGSAAAPLAVQNGDLVTRLIYNGYDGTAFAPACAFLAYASEDWTPTSHGSQMQFSSVANGTTTAILRLIIDQNGDLLPGGDGSINLGSAAHRWKAVYAVNGTIQTSDVRLKKNVKSLGLGLETVMKLHPVTYDWKDNSGTNKIGFIAQELKKTVPSVVVGNETKENLGVNYSELIPVLTKAIQQQQAEIEKLKNENAQLKQLAIQVKEIQQTIGINQKSNGGIDVSASNKVKSEKTTK